MSQSEKPSQFASTDAVRLELRARSVRGATALALGAGGEIVVRFASIIILARVLVPEDFGLIGIVTALAAIAGMFSGLGLSTATVQRHEINHRQVTNLFWINLAIGLTLTGVFLILAPLIASFYDDPRLTPIILVISTTFIWGSCTVQHEALLIRQMQQTRTASIRLAASFLSVVVAIVLAATDFGYWALVWQEVTRTFLIAAGVWLLCPWRPGLPYRSESVRSFVRFGVELTLTHLLYVLANNVDRLIVGKLFGVSALGLYRQAQQLIMVPIEQLNQPIASVAQPGLSILQKDPERYRRYYEKVVFLIGLGTMPLSGLVMVYAPEITALALGPAWTGAAPFISIFAAAAFIRPVLGSASLVLITLGKSRRLLAMTILSNMTLLGLIGVGVAGGPEGVALAQLFTPALLLLPNLFLCFVGSPVTVAAFFRAIRMPVVASAVMIAGLVAFRMIVPGYDNLVSLCYGIGLGAVLYVASCLLLPGGRAKVSDLLVDLATLRPTTTLRPWKKDPAKEVGEKSCL
jgi:O-antigen/teichoic acid export membrane protein